MIDLHCHILFGVDDGPEVLEDSLKMANKAVNQGIAEILCTPHHLNGRYINNPKEIILKTNKLQKELDERSIPLVLHPGQEIRVVDTLLEDIANNKIMTMGLNSKYLLLEFPTREIPEYSEALFHELLVKGYIPVIAHPERNREFIEHPNLLLSFLSMGVLTQLTAPSIVGVYGRKVKKAAELMINHGFIQLVSSDAHALHNRDFLLKEAWDIIRKKQGEKMVEMLKKNEKNVLVGSIIQPSEFKAIQRKKFFFKK